MATKKHPFDEAIPASAMKTREENGRTFTYIDGYYAITVANKLLGHNGWSYTVANLSQVQCEQKKNRNDKLLWYVAYTATCQVVATFNDQTITRQDVGYGSGIDADLGRAHESAAKEAATDALKRALRSLGEAFGLQLYDKTGGAARDAVESIGKVDPKALVKSWDLGGDELAALKEQCKAVGKSFGPELVAAFVDEYPGDDHGLDAFIDYVGCPAEAAAS